MSTVKLLAEAAARPIRERISATLQSAAWMAVVIVFALVAVGFGLAALHDWLARRFGSLEASLILAGAFLVLAILAAIVRAVIVSSRAAVARRETERSAEALRAALGSAAGLASAAASLGGGRGAAASAGFRLGQRVGPWTLIGIALMGGFVGAHFIDRGRR